MIDTIRYLTFFDTSDDDFLYKVFTLKAFSLQTVIPLLLYLGQTALQASILLCANVSSRTRHDREALFLHDLPLYFRTVLITACLLLLVLFGSASAPVLLCCYPFPRLKRKRPHHVYGKSIRILVWERNLHDILQSARGVLVDCWLAGWLKWSVGWLSLGNDSGWIYQCRLIAAGC